MKVKVGNKVYDGEKEPVMVIFNAEERQQIAEMHPECKKYCVYPAEEHWTENNFEKIMKWMEEI